MRPLIGECTLVVEMTTRQSIARGVLPRLRGYLALKGLTQLDLANRLGRPVSTVNSWLRGVGRPPTDLVRRIERVLRVPAGTLSGDGAQIPRSRDEG